MLFLLDLFLMNIDRVSYAGISPLRAQIDLDFGGWIKKLCRHFFFHFFFNIYRRHLYPLNKV